MTANAQSGKKAKEVRPLLPKPERFSDPVAWLFGPQLIGSLKGIIVHWLYKDLDIRDWMYAPGPIDMKAECHWSADEEARGDAFWFDYLADTGDGQRPTYSVAYLASAELAATKDAALGAKLRVVKQGDQLDPEREMALPAGRFLFVGGDTAYHVANLVTLGNRFEAPFRWAREDLIKDKAKGDWKRERPLVGIPGNHDYYDMLDGFNRQFRKPISERLNTDAERKGELSVPGLRRVQETSYFAAHLPHDWWLYAFDTEQDELDFRQAEFFRSLRDKKTNKQPAKLIVATPTPTTVFDVRPSKTEAIVVSLAEVGLPLPAAEDIVDSSLAEGECRLDLSGDVHHYARYWGPRVPDGSKQAEQSASYASVVSGLGGAFHHPSSTTHGDLKPQVRYPDPAVSNRAISTRLFAPWVIIKGGYVGSIGALIAALFTGALLVRGTTRGVMDSIARAILGAPSPVKAETADSANPSLAVFGALLVLLLSLATGVALARKIYKKNPDAGKRRYFGAFTLAFGGIAGFSTTLWWARRSPSGQVGFDVVFYFVAGALIVGLIVLGSKLGAGGRSRGVKAMFAGFGVVHLLMHTLPVALLIRFGSLFAGGLFVLSSLVSLGLGVLLLRWQSRWASPVALVTWLVSSAWLLALPFVVHRHTELFKEPEVDLKLVGLIAVALLAGFVHCCIQFAWYLAVSHLHNGHNNEVGGASRIERFKQFIRFKVEKDRITGYVIAFDQPKQNGSELEPFLCDVFTLETKKAKS